MKTLINNRKINNQLKGHSLIKPLKIQRRFMHRAGPIIRHIPHSHYNFNTARSYSTRTAAQLSKQAAKDLSNDGTGKHAHVFENYCVLQGCENKKCTTLCDENQTSRILGHNTHKPPIGRLTRFMSDHDANNDAHSQYFVKSNEKKEITAQEKQQYNAQIKDNVTQTNFVNKNYDKYNDT